MNCFFCDKEIDGTRNLDNTEICIDCLFDLKGIKKEVDENNTKNINETKENTNNILDIL